MNRTLHAIKHVCGYAVRVEHGVFFGERLFQARVEALPDLVEYAPTAGEAIDLVRDAIEVTSAALAERGLSLPAPDASTQGPGTGSARKS
jgi:hypothetical protein